MVISRFIQTTLNRIWAILDYYSQKYNNVTIIGDFNVTTENTRLQSIQSKQLKYDLVSKYDVSNLTI